MTITAAWGENGCFLMAQLIHKNASLAVRLLSNASAGPRETRRKAGWAKLMLLAGRRQRQQPEILDLWKGKVQADTRCKRANVCMYACKSTNLSSSRGSHPCSRWETAGCTGRRGMCHPGVGSFGPVTCGERTCSNNGKHESPCFYVTDRHLCGSSFKKTKATYVYQSFWWWIMALPTPLPTGSFADLLSRNSWSFCFTSVLATAPVRPKEGSSRIGVTLGHKRTDAQGSFQSCRHINGLLTLIIASDSF